MPPCSWPTLAVLQLRPKGEPLEWLKIILSDLEVAHCRVIMLRARPSSHLLCRMGQVHCGSARWAKVVERFHYVESRLDKAVATHTLNVGAHSCAKCQVCLPTSRARDSHVRSKHKIRADQRMYCEADGICPVCKVQLQSRLRLLAHLSDSRRDKCWSCIRDTPRKYPRLKVDGANALDESDRIARRNAQRGGRSHVIAVGSAQKASGAIVGRVSS